MSRLTLCGWLGYACPTFAIEIGPGNLRGLNRSSPWGRGPNANSELGPLQRSKRRQKVAYSHTFHTTMKNYMSQQDFEVDARKQLPRKSSPTNRSEKWFGLLESYEECSIEKRDKDCKASTC